MKLIAFQILLHVISINIILTANMITFSQGDWTWVLGAVLLFAISSAIYYINEAVNRSILSALEGQLHQIFQEQLIKKQVQKNTGGPNES